ncbi:MAG: glutamate-cysteine ligase family protein [Actinomycetota bacterium]|nr:glutamate-cysteine ligase family protein [Actinomycetota bacterium]
MPSARRTLSFQDVRSHVRDEISGSLSEGCVGVELEWLALDPQKPEKVIPLELLEQLLDPAEPLPSGGRLTFEPGGQVEISSSPTSCLRIVCPAASADIGLIQSKLSTLGIRLIGVGLNPYRSSPRLLDLPRYRAMEEYLDNEWPKGRSMMRDTASVQVNIDAGLGEEAARWRFVHALGPALTACFSNSAILNGRPTGWRSTRMATWQSLDASRTRPASGTGDPVTDWTDYALQARVMFIKRAEEDLQPVLTPLTFGEWIDRGHDHRYPTIEDLALHLTTLFPPVRPRGWLELRMIDALPDPWWRVPLAICTALVYDRLAFKRAEKVLEPVADLWVEAAMQGMSHPRLANAVRICFANAMNALEGMDVDSETIAATRDYYDRYVRRGRSPADDQLALWTALGAIKGTDDSLEAIWG